MSPDPGTVFGDSEIIETFSILAEGQTRHDVSNYACVAMSLFRLHIKSGNETNFSKTRYVKLDTTAQKGRCRQIEGMDCIQITYM